ncbi:hypothetical protein CU664_04100 [Pseudomonas syringae pv. actinidifoliorum]|nr:hypothetical protein [Pseudomonas syringae pv. actinidifoliorum]NAT62540.1 hypothetical protein [Pseudomonas syringae pv. actinidifoliorum]
MIAGQLQELLRTAAFAHRASFAIVSFSDATPALCNAVDSDGNVVNAAKLRILLRLIDAMALSRDFEGPRPHATQPPRWLRAAERITFWVSVALQNQDGTHLGHLNIIDLQRTQPVDSHESTILSLYGKLISKELCDVRAHALAADYCALPSRRALHADLANLQATQAHYLFVVDFFPVSYLTDLTQVFGYDALEDAMQALDGAVRRSAAPEQRAYQLHPGRYALLVSALSAKTAERAINQFTEDFQAPLLADGLPLKIQMHIGALDLAGFASLRPDWIRMTATAAEESRANNFDILWYSQCIDATSQRKFKLARSFSAALETKGQLYLVYQPRINITRGNVVAAEALLRWTHPQLGPIGPDEFIPIAEQSGAINAISLWVMEHVIQQVIDWHTLGPSFKVSFNVSMKDLGDSQFTDRMIALIKTSGVDASRLELEVTETAVAADFKAVNTQLGRLVAAGVQIALDDFGTGYSNWEQVRELLVTTVKLDRSLTQGLERDKNDRHLMSTLLGVLTFLGYDIVAEGVESADICELLGNLGCHQAQGFHIARPMPAQDLQAWIERQDQAVL